MQNNLIGVEKAKADRFVINFRGIDIQRLKEKSQVRSGTTDQTF